MEFLLNLAWFVLIGWLIALAWFVIGVLCCITVVLAPFGTQCFKFARLALAPFGSQIEYGGGTVSLLANIIWLIFPGLELAGSCVAAGVTLCLTIIGIPLGLQLFKFAKLALMPFGARIID